MKVVVLCDGDTERALKPGLLAFAHGRTVGKRVGVAMIKLGGAAARPKLARILENHLSEADVAGAVVLTDVYPNYGTADEAKSAIARFAGDAAKDPRFRAHIAKFEVEAWLIPFWNEIRSHLRVDVAKPGARPEEINSQKPPSKYLIDLFARARKKYNKVLFAQKWLTAERLERAAAECPELKLFLNSLLQFSGAEPLP